jgi:hypothetical protein
MDSAVRLRGGSGAGASGGLQRWRGGVHGGEGDGMAQSRRRLLMDSAVRLRGGSGAEQAEVYGAGAVRVGLYKATHYPTRIRRTSITLV